MPAKYPQTFKDRAVHMVQDRFEAGDEGLSRYQVIKERAEAERVDRGTTPLGRPGRDQAPQARGLAATPRERDPEDRLGVFRHRARPAHAEMIAHVDMYRDQFGVELVCRTLGTTDGGFFTSHGYSDRALRDAELVLVIERIHADNYGVYGAQKIWRAMR